MNKSEKEVLEREIASAKGLLTKAKENLAYYKSRLAEQPWNAEWDHAVNEQEHLVGALEFRIKNLKAELKA